MVFLPVVPQAQPFALPVTEHGANEPSAERYVMRGAAEPLLYKAGLALHG